MKNLILFKILFILTISTFVGVTAHSLLAQETETTPSCTVSEAKFQTQQSNEYKFSYFYSYAKARPTVPIEIYTENCMGKNIVVEIMDNHGTFTGVAFSKVINVQEEADLLLFLKAGENKCDSEVDVFDCQYFLRVREHQQTGPGDTLYSSLNKPDGNLFYDCNDTCLTDWEYLTVPADVDPWEICTPTDFYMTPNDLMEGDWFNENMLSTVDITVETYGCEGKEIKVKLVSINYVQKRLINDVEDSPAFSNYLERVVGGTSRYVTAFNNNLPMRVDESGTLIVKTTPGENNCFSRICAYYIEIENDLGFSFNPETDEANILYMCSIDENRIPEGLNGEMVQDLGQVLNAVWHSLTAGLFYSPGDNGFIDLLEVLWESYEMGDVLCQPISSWKVFHTNEVDENMEPFYTDDVQVSTLSADDPCAITDEAGITTLKDDCYTLLAPIGGFNKMEGATLGKYFNIVIQIVISIAGVLAVIMIIVGGVQYMTTDAFAGKSDARETITKALLGLVLALGSYLILKTINPNLLQLEPNIQKVSYSVDDPPKQNSNKTYQATDPLVKDLTQGTVWPGTLASQLTDIRPSLPEGVSVNKGDCQTVGSGACTSTYFKTDVAQEILSQLTALRTACQNCKIVITGGSEFWLHRTHGPSKPVLDLSVLHEQHASLSADDVTKLNQALSSKASFPADNVWYRVFSSFPALAEKPNNPALIHWHLDANK